MMNLKKLKIKNQTKNENKKII
ncbi:hypothetical protein M6B38_306510 [Iris pallida]|uniref:Uncharacterized protein n=1 Tax=Iris pallida TaxID=29817 RepID=A0AAX6HMF3_IRIPA|nr:hypothetical protein M6B38_306510 [Iris pallida]